MMNLKCVRLNASLHLDNDPLVNQFRNAVVDFAQREVAPRAAEIDKTNTSPLVSCSMLSFALLVTLGSRIYGRSWVPWASSVSPLTKSTVV